MKTTLVTVVAILATSVRSSLVFMVATEPNNKGITHSWVTDRWVCEYSDEYDHGFSAHARQATSLQKLVFTRTSRMPMYLLGLPTDAACMRKYC